MSKTYKINYEDCELTPGGPPRDSEEPYVDFEECEMCDKEITQTLTKSNNSANTAKEVAGTALWEGLKMFIHVLDEGLNRK